MKIAWKQLLGQNAGEGCEFEGSRAEARRYFEEITLRTDRLLVLKPGRAWLLVCPALTYLLWSEEDR